MKYKFEIKERLPGLNEYTAYNRTNRFAGANLKKKTEEHIYYYILEQLKNIKINKKVFIKFTWVKENGKRDLDNICFAKKFILDALVKAGVLKNDNKSHISGFIDKFEYADKSKVIVELEEI